MTRPGLPYQGGDPGQVIAGHERRLSQQERQLRVRSTPNSVVPGSQSTIGGAVVALAGTTLDVCWVASSTATTITHEANILSNFTPTIADAALVENTAPHVFTFPSTYGGSSTLVFDILPGFLYLVGARVVWENSTAGSRSLGLGGAGTALSAASGAYVTQRAITGTTNMMMEVATVVWSPAVSNYVIPKASQSSGGDLDLLEAELWAVRLAPTDFSGF